jgi:hypothetical protein
MNKTFNRCPLHRLTNLSVISTTIKALLARLDDQIYYGTTPNITWLADANYSQTSGYDADGKMTWDQFQTWGGTLVPTTWGRSSTVYI